MAYRCKPASKFHGRLDPDAVLGGEWGRSMGGCIRWGSHALREGEVLGVLRSIALNGVFFNRNVFDSCVKI